MNIIDSNDNNTSVLLAPVEPCFLVSLALPVSGDGYKGDGARTDGYRGEEKEEEHREEAGYLESQLLGIG